MPDLAAAETTGGWGPALGQRVVSRLCSVLLGLSGGIYLGGLVARFESLFDPLPRTSASVISIALICAGLGPWLPQRVVSRFLELLVRQVRAPGRVSAGQTSAILRGQDAAKRRAWWLVGAILSLAAGLSAVLSLVLLDWLTAAHAWVLAQMLPTVRTLRVIEWLMTLIVVGPVWLLAGLTVASLHAHYLNPDQPGRSRSLALGVLVGVALSLPAAFELILPYGSASHAMLIGSAGFFMVAVICIVVAIEVEKGTFVRVRVSRFSPPEAAERLHGLILSGLLCWGLSVGLGAGVWWRVASYERAAGAWLESSFFSAWLLWMAAGVAAAGLIAPTRRHSPEGCGIALWTAGLASAGAVGLLALVRPDFTIQVPVAEVALRPAALAAAVSGFFSGMALPYAKRALMVQCGGQPITYAELMSAVLIGVGVGLYVGVAWLISWLGVFGVQCLAGLACMVLGGILVINEAGAAARMQWLRGTLVLGSLVALLVLVPGWVRRADLAGDGLAEALRGRSWSVKSLSAAPSGDAAVAPTAKRGSGRGAVAAATERSLTEQLLASLGAGDLGRRACVIGGELGSPQPCAAAGFRYLECWTHDGVVRHEGSGPGDSRTAAESTRLRVVHRDGPALGAWRRWRGPFDLVVLWPVEAGSVANPSIWTAEAFVALRRCLGPGGRLVVVLPTVDLDAATLSVVAAGFRAALRGRAAWRIYPSVESVEQIWLLGARPPTAVGSPDADAARGWRSLNEIAPAKGPYPLHSFQTPRVGLALASGSDEGRRRSSLRALVLPGTSQVR